MKKDFNYINWHKDHAKAWKAMPSPARPSIGEIKIFEKYLQSYSQGNSNKIKVLILGATPEFRDLCNKDRYEVTCIDINKEIYKALTLLQKSVNEKERFINANWLTFKTSNKFDVIIGDVPTAMFPLRFHKQFFQNMSVHLVKNGLLIIRVPYQNKDFRISPKRIFENYRNTYRRKGLDIYTATFTYLALYYLDEQKSGVSLSYLYDQIKKLNKQKVILNSEMSKLRKYYENLTLWLYYPSEAFLYESIKKNFNCVAKEFSLDYPVSLCHPIYILDGVVTQITVRNIKKTSRVRK